MTAENHMSVYQPPYDSPIEEILAWHLHKHLNREVELRKQVEFNTNHGLFRIDFILYYRDRIVAIECDGRDFHDALRDEIRDSILLGEKHVDTIYHFRGCDITYYPDDCVWLISSLESNLFSKRGHIHLNRLKKVELSEHDVLELYENEQLSLMASDNIDNPIHFRAFRRSIYCMPELDYHWKVLYKFSCEHPGRNLDELLDLDLHGEITVTDEC